MRRILISVLCVMQFSCFLFGQNSTALEKKKYNAVYINTAPAIDGNVNEEVWEQGTWIDEFIQHEPYNGRPATQRTEFKILYDDDNLYVGIKAYDTSPDSIVKRLTRRDQLDGDIVAVILDSYHDLRTGFLFGVSVAGVRFDLLFSNDGQNQDPSWDPNWWGRTTTNDDGWVAEMKIPFSQLRFEKNSGNVWGLQVARIIYRNNETTFWQHIPKDAPGFIHLIGEMTGLEKIKPRKIFDITPYGVAKAEKFKAELENPFLKAGKRYGLNGGIDAKIGVTNNMTIDLTINPDFGQVEADPSEVNLTAYETFFSEKRPFFIEGNNITNFGLGLGDGDIGNDNLFYSRRIGRRPQGYPDLKDGWNADLPTATTILGAAKLTGKTQDGLSVGFIEAITAEEKAEIDTVGGRTYETVEPLTNYFVGRLQKDINEGKTIIGGIFTSTNRNVDDNLASFMHKNALSGGVDFTQYFKKKSWMFNLNVAFSNVSGTKEAIDLTQRSSARYYQRPDNDYVKYDPDRTSLFGSGGRMQIGKLDGHVNIMGAVIWKTPGFETNDLGFIRQADQILSVLWIGYNQWEPKGIYRSYRFGGDIYSTHNFGGDWIGKGFEWNGNMTFKNFWRVWTGGNLNTSQLSTGMLRGGPMMKLPGSYHLRAGFSTDNRKKLVLQVYANRNQGFEGSSSSWYTGADISYKPTNYMRLSFSPAFNPSFSELQYITRKISGSETKYIFASIDRKTLSASLRINLNISPDLTLQYWGQPFIATGKYSEFKHVTEPMAGEYQDRYHIYTSGQISLNSGSYYIDENTDGTADYSFGKPDFNVQEFLSNLVIRWEYNPGSSIYLVWSQSRSCFNDSGQMDVFDDLGDLFNCKDNKPHNVFLIKFSYRFGLR
ncbi:MAG: DUF5916 domain-containing protein [Bacteroidales bacterium]